MAKRCSRCRVACRVGSAAGGTAQIQKLTAAAVPFEDRSSLSRSIRHHFQHASIFRMRAHGLEPRVNRQCLLRADKTTLSGSSDSVERQICTHPRIMSCEIEPAFRSSIGCNSICSACFSNCRRPGPPLWRDRQAD
jgi:hypothetical protein